MLRPKPNPMTSAAVRAALCAVALITTVPASATAQIPPPTTLSVQDILRFVVTNQGVVTDDMQTDLEAAEATRDTLTRALLSSIATLPLSSSSGGFNYRLDPTLGTVERASDTFGPFYTERALTSGAGQAAFGFSLRYVSFRSLDGNDLRSGNLVTVANQFVDEPAPYDLEALSLNMTIGTATFFGNIGVSDRVDVGVAVPLVRLTIDGTRLNNYRGETLLQARARATSVGFADIAVRSKVRLTPADSAGAIAAGVEARLPTGREEDLLGTGDVTLRFLGMASYESGPAGVYGNVAVGTRGLGREVSWGGAATFAPTARLTLVGELVMRRQAGIQGITEVTEPHPRIANVLTSRLVPSGEDETTAFTVAGFKWNLGSTWLLHANVLIPVSENGLTARFTPAISLDYSFAR